MSTTAEQRMNDLVGRLVSEARKRVDPAHAESVEIFVRRYFAHVAPDDVIYSSFDNLIGSVLSLWHLGAQRQPGAATVRVFNPTAEEHGWTSEHTIVEIVNDDMPFLVDSVTAEVNRRGRNVHLLLHPVVTVERDGSGKRLSLRAEAAGAGTAESFMHFEVDEETGPADLDSIRSGIEHVLSEVRLAVTDWSSMRERLAANLAELDSSKVPMTQEDVDDAKSFLQWLDRGHFVFLGYRRYDFEERDGNDYLHPVADSGLGILREIRPESVRRSAAPLPPLFSAYAHTRDLLIVTKANSVSVIHRPVPMDRIGIKRYDVNGRLLGEDRYLGLFTSAAYSRSVREIPTLRLKFQRVMDQSGFEPHSHNGKALVDILESYPRDEFFQITDADLMEITRGILLLQERQRVALFTRKDLFERFVSCLVFVPRDRYTPDFKERARAILEQAFEGRDTSIYDHVTTAPLARGLFIVQTSAGKVPQPDVRVLEKRLAEAARTWSDRLLDALVHRDGEEAGIEAHHRFKKAFPMAYAERFSAEAALYDIQHVEDVLSTGRLVVDLYRHRTDRREFHVKIIHAGAPVPLSDLMPRLENMGVRVQSEVPYEIQPLGAAYPVRIRDFSLSAEGLDDDLTAVKEKFQEAFTRVWTRDAENDAFNTLVLRGRLEWHEVALLRAWCKYVRQIGTQLSEAYIQQTLAAHSSVARLLIDLFAARFDPSRPAESRESDAAAVLARIEDALEKVKNPDEDRILRLYVTVIEATLRTNYYQRTDSGERKPYISFKLDSQRIRELPLPRPWVEIFVYAPHMEGIHLRGGKVARGGIRWSDRREDFRTEILGLMKAQNVKNVVIVPMGSKGGFVVKNPSSDRETFMKEGVESYKTLLRGMLDITDNTRGDEVVPPRDVVRRDGDDPYLVVAADKGTATFSDIANSVSAEYGFWLGDAFASGGSAGYDHKKMGITARGAWEAVKRHFRELGVDTQTQDFTVVGVGDMSGDVFGNGMLLSPHIKLVAAFNHSHIFLDPEPDPAASLAERRRLFEQRLNWNGYDTAKLSQGGAVFERTAKSITVSEHVQRLFELPQTVVTPVEMMRAILKADVDLLWLGGIGTYVKSSDEDQAAARDRANDAIRIDGSELRVKVVGEGANLGMTQAGRIEFALRGGRLNTDAIDNSAGVDTSDHEVNIKILLNDAVARGELETEDRNALLARMTDDVAGLVLRDNYEQTQALTITQALGVAPLDVQARFMRALERAGRLNRAVEGLPDDETIAERTAAHVGLARPELAILLAYAKIAVYQDLLASDLPDDPALAHELRLYFPPELRDRYDAAIGRHKLRREIVATVVTNALVNRLRPTFVWQAAEESGRTTADVARAFSVMRDAFDLRSVWSEIAALDNKVPAAVQTEMMLEVERLLERSIVWLLRSAIERFDVSAFISQFRPLIESLEGRLDEILPATILTGVRARESNLVGLGIPASLAHRIAALNLMSSALDIVRINEKAGAPGIDRVARTYFGVGARFGLDRLRAAAAMVPSDTPWQKAAVAAVVDDLFNYQGIVAARVIAESEGSDALDRWLAARGPVAERVDQTVNELRNAAAIDLAMLTVASRQLRALAES